MFSVINSTDPDCYELIKNKGEYTLATIPPQGNMTSGKTENG